MKKDAGGGADMLRRIHSVAAGAVQIQRSWESLINLVRKISNPMFRKNLLKVLLSIVCIILFTLFILYLNRFSFRNEDSTIGHITNRIWNLNRVRIVDKCKGNIRIVWSCEGDTSVVFDDKASEKYNIPNKYGPNSLDVFVDDELIETFMIVKTSWWLTADYCFYLYPNKVLLVTKPEILNVFVNHHPLRDSVPSDKK